MRSRLGIAWVGALVALAPSCSLVLGYPAASDERGALACHDGIDQDLDRHVDCDDEDCAASCPETCSGGRDDDFDHAIDCADADCDGAPECSEDVAELCADGRDNDRDGRIDARDAGCWPHATIEAHRCASVLASSLTLGPEDFPIATLVDDPSGTGSGPWARVHADVTGGLEPTQSTGFSTGAIEGTSASFVLHVHRTRNASGALTPLGPIIVGLTEPPTTRAPGLGHGIFLDRERLFLLESPANPVMASFTAPDLDWVRVQIDLDIADQLITTDVMIEGLPAPLHLSTPLAYDAADDARAYGAEVDTPLAESATTIWIESVTVHRERLVRCGTPPPPFSVVERDGVEHANAALQSLARGEGARLCGAMAMPERAGVVRVYAITSDDDGASFRRGEVLWGPSSHPGAADGGPPVTIAWDPMEGAWQSAVLDRSTTGGIVRLVTARSEDCEHWDRPVTAAEDVARGGTLALSGVPAIVEHRVDADGHAISFVGWDATLAAAFVTWRSPWGDPGSWVESSADTSVGPLLPRGEAISGLVVRLTAIDLGARVLAFPSAPALAGTRLGWVPVPGLVTGASGEAGAFDALSLSPITILEDACEADDTSRVDVFCGRLFASGLYDAADESGWGTVRLRIAPRSR